MAVLAPVTRQRFFDADGNPLSGGKIWTYEAGTTTPKTSWKDKNKAVAHSNPIDLDSEGYAPDVIYIEGSYKMSYFDSSDVLSHEDDKVDPLNVGQNIGRKYLNLANVIADDTLSAGEKGGVTGLGDFEIVDANPNSYFKELSSGGVYAKPLTMNVELFGAAVDGVTDDTTEFEAACAYAASVGIKRVRVPSDIVLTDANASGCIIEGDDISVTGMIKNHAGLYGVKIENIRQDIKNNYPVEQATDSAKLVYRSNVDKYLIMTKKTGRKKAGVIFEMIKGITTSTNSLGVDQEFLRAGWVHNNTGIYAWDDNASETGTWSDYSVPDTYLNHSSDDTQRQPVIRRGEVGAYAEYSINVRTGQTPNVAIMGTGASPTFDVSVDGVVHSSYDASDWSGEVNAISLNVAPGARTIRVTHTGGSGQLYVFGLNFRAIGDIDSEEVYSEWAAYRNANLPRYVQNEGAHDYAVYDDDSNLWGGSFHGGETVSTSEFVLDGVADALPIYSDGGLSASEDVYLRQRTNIDWTGSGSGVIRTESITRFRDGQIQLDVAFTSTGADFYAQRFYTAMHGTHENFDRIVFPIEEAIVLDGPEILLGQNSKVVLRHAASSSLSITDFRLFDDLESDRGGARIDPISGSYNKIYYGPVLNGRRLIDKLSATTVRTFR